MVVVRTEKFFSHACNGLGNVKENVGDRSLGSGHTDFGAHTPIIRTLTSEYHLKISRITRNVFFRNISVFRE